MASPKGSLTRTELWDAGLFPILTGEYGSGEGVAVPLYLVLPHEKQAQHNHGQTLHRLAERGGLSVDELVAVLEDRPWRRMRNDEAWHAVYRAHATYVHSSPVARGFSVLLAALLKQGYFENDTIEPKVREFLTNNPLLDDTRSVDEVLHAAMGIKWTAR